MLDVENYLLGTRFQYSFFFKGIIKATMTIIKETKQFPTRATTFIQLPLINVTKLFFLVPITHAQRTVCNDLVDGGKSIQTVFNIIIIILIVV